MIGKESTCKSLLIDMKWFLRTWHSTLTSIKPQTQFQMKKIMKLGDVTKGGYYRRLKMKKLEFKNKLWC